MDYENEYNGKQKLNFDEIIQDGIELPMGSELKSRVEEIQALERRIKEYNSVLSSKEAAFGDEFMNQKLSIENEGNKRHVESLRKTIEEKLKNQ